ncbi:MAG: TIGR03560 family F420-dependent LLM class oxidoreductase [Candidatus Heimdallarchaeota archaeon]|nr:TIGR03560 family F420-dependent LLM class oxidoreductase [Candidatus Heimdallarchaeota archaeon]
MTLKFSVQIENQFGYNWDQTKEIINKTEEHGFHSFYICDHFFLDNESESRHALEAWLVLTAAAMITKKIKLGTLVAGNNYRNPAYLAKIAASLDMISGNRMEFGIGAGWKQIEYEAYGYDFPSISVRMEMLEESLQIIKSLFTKSRTNFEGKHYNIKNAAFSPKPDNPLILIGGGGEKKSLKFVAKYADYMNLPFTPIEKVQQKLDALKGHCNDIGREYDEVGKSYFGPAWIGESDEEVEKHLEQRAKLANMSIGELKNRLYHPDHPGGWMGTPEQLRDRIEHMQAMGFDYFFLQQPIDLSSVQIDKFANLVMKKYFR